VPHAWARATSARNGAAYLTLVDQGAADRLTGLSTPVASAAELHQTTAEGGVMKMRPVEGGLALAAGQTVTMAPGGYHIMLMGLKQPLKVGDRFALTLTFEHAPEMTVDVSVEKAGAMTPPTGGHEGMDMGGMKMGQ
jgi:copper(I)-binding protein